MSAATVPPPPDGLVIREAQCCWEDACLLAKVHLHAWHTTGPSPFTYYVPNYEAYPYDGFLSIAQFYLIHLSNPTHLTLIAEMPGNKCVGYSIADRLEMSADGVLGPSACKGVVVRHEWSLKEKLVNSALWLWYKTIRNRATPNLIERYAKFDEWILSTIGGYLKKWDPEYKGPVWYYDITAVMEQYRGKGIGSALLSPMVERAENEGVPALLFASNMGKPVYTKRGFHVTKEAAFKDPFGHNDMKTLGMMRPRPGKEFEEL